MHDAATVTDRRDFIGGSDAAAVLGISPWKSPLDLYFEKTTPPDPARDAENAKAKLRGKRLEPYIVDMLRSELGMSVERTGLRLADPEHPFLSAEIDVIADGMPVEIKTVHPFKAKDWGEEGGDEIPPWYQAQAMHGQMVGGYEATLFAVLIGDDLRTYRLARDSEIIAGMRAREIAFWHDHVLAKAPPAPRTPEDVLRLFARDNGTGIEADEYALSCYTRLVEAKAAAKKADDLAAELKVFMGEHRILLHAGKVLATWSTENGGARLAERELAAAHPAIYAAFKRDTTRRVLRLK